jgi:hypothetical protein
MALLLTVVSVEEFDDPVLHRDQAARATALAERIATPGSDPPRR